MFTGIKKRWRFGVFHADARTGELYRNGVKLRLQEQPFQVLVALLERPDEVVTRDELRQRLWPRDTFVEFDHSLNAAVNRLREVLGDSAANPHFIETLPKRGYRFIAPVDPFAPSAAEPGEAEETEAPAQPGSRRVMPAVAWVAAVVLVAVVAAGYLLRRPGSKAASPPAGKIMLAVLPLENLTGDEEQHYFVEGLHEEMVSRLGRLQPQRLGVIARTSVLQYRRAARPLPEIARELGVDYVLEGSVRRAGNTVRVTAQLIQVSDQAHLWAETYERSLRDIFALQSEVGARVADSLLLELLPRQGAAVEPRADITPEAYLEYLRGRYYWNQRTRGGVHPGAMLLRAVGSFERAIQMAPDFAPAHAGLADAYNSIGFSHPARVPEVRPKAEEALTKALELDPNLASARATRAWTSFLLDRDWRKAEQEFQIAFRLDPNDSVIHSRYSLFLSAMGRLEEAEWEAKRAKQLDPLSPQASAWLANVLYLAGKDQESIEERRRISETSGLLGREHYWAAYVAAVRANCGEAKRQLDEAPQIGKYTDLEAPDQFMHAYVLSRCGNPAQTAALVEEYVGSRPISVFSAAVLAAVRRNDEAVEQLWKGLENHESQITFCGVDPVLDPLRRHPRFKELLRTLNLPESALRPAP